MRVGFDGGIKLEFLSVKVTLGGVLMYDSRFTGYEVFNDARQIRYISVGCRKNTGTCR